MRDGKAIKGATKRRYKLTKANWGHRISVQVTAMRDAYNSASSRSARTKRITR